MLFLQARSSRKEAGGYNMENAQPLCERGIK